MGLPMRWIWFFCGVSFLLIGSYMDNARGPLFPALSELMQFDYRTTGNLLVFGNLAAFTLTWLLMPVTNRWSLRTVSLVAAFLLIILCAATYFVTSVNHLYFWAACVGGIVSVMGALSNLYVKVAAPPAVISRAMSGVHAAYGLASFIAPLIAGQILEVPDHWRWIYFFAIIPAIVLGLVCMKVAPRESSRKGTDVKQAIWLKPEHCLAIGVMIFYVAGEVITSMWMTSWLVSHGRTLQEGAEYTALFFALMTGTRLLCSVFVTVRWMWVVMWSALILAAVSFTCGRLLHLPWLVAGMGLLGPFFPLYMSHLTMIYPSRDRTIVIWVLATMQGLLAVMNLSMGQLATYYGIDVAYWLAPLMIGVSASLLLVVRWKLKIREVSAS